MKSSGRSCCTSVTTTVTFLPPSYCLLTILFLQLLVLTNKSVLSFTCLPQTPVLKHSTSNDHHGRCRHYHQLLQILVTQQQQQQLQTNRIIRRAPQCILHHSNTKSIDKSCSSGSISVSIYKPMTKRLPRIKWGVPTQKISRTDVSASTISQLYSSSSSSSNNSYGDNSNSRLVTAVVDTSNNSNNNKNNEDQIEAIQMIFTNYCDADGLMTKTDVRKVPYIADLLVCMNTCVSSLSLYR
jgi:hypothetical protein